MRIKPANLFLAVLSGSILGTAWFTPFTLLIFIGLIPLFLLTENIHASELRRKSLRIWAFSYLAFFIWNVITTWWVYKASLGGAALAFICNALLMSGVYLIWYQAERRIYGKLKFWLLIPLWLAFEHGHSLWDLTWTWINLGNVFCNTTYLIQWYEITGVSGGSLWVLVINILLAKVALGDYKIARAYLKPLSLVLIPVIISLIISSVRTIVPDKKINVTVIQPNIDPYNEKFILDYNLQLSLLHQHLEQMKLNKETQLVVLPETFVIEDVRENDYNTSQQLASLITLMKIHFPKAAILAGASTYKILPLDQKPTATARKLDDSKGYYDMYNAAIYIDTLRNCTFYHKSKLVPGVERMPFPGIFKYFEKYAINMGGTSGSLATQEERTVFNDEVYNMKIAPAVCYESVYGDFMASYIRGGAQVICIVTNDGWWENTPGHRQHLAYARLRAIETRKQIIRSANTGISCFMDETGAIDQPQPYWEFAVINQDISFNSVKTFFVRFGDLISYTSVLFALVILTYSYYLRFKNKRIN